MRLAGVEPAAQSLGNSCSIQVSYRRRLFSFKFNQGMYLVPLELIFAF